MNDVTIFKNPIEALNKNIIVLMVNSLVRLTS